MGLFKWFKVLRERRRERRKQRLLHELAMLRAEIAYQQQQLGEKRITFAMALGKEGLDRLKHDIRHHLIMEPVDWRAKEIDGQYELKQSIQSLKDRKHELEMAVLSISLN